MSRFRAIETSRSGRHVLSETRSIIIEDYNDLNYTMLFDTSNNLTLIIIRLQIYICLLSSANLRLLPSRINKNLLRTINFYYALFRVSPFKEAF